MTPQRLDAKYLKKKFLRKNLEFEYWNDSSVNPARVIDM